MKKILIWIVLFLTLFIPQEVLASEDYFENPEDVYEQFRNEIYYDGYEVKYGFAREASPVYTDHYGSEVGGQLEKFHGLIVVSETESYVQIIYKNAGEYETGWIDQVFYQEEVKFYNGAEKQLLGDGIYEMEDSEKNCTYYIELTFEGNQQYSLRSLRTEKYLDVVFDETGRAKGLYWTGKSEEASQRWKLIREYDRFYVKNVETGTYLVLKGEKGLGLASFVIGLDNNFSKEGIREIHYEDGWTFTRKFENNVDPYRNFLQYDPDWAMNDYGKVDGDYSGKMAAAGCGPLATTNMIYALTGQFIDPMVIADFAVEQRYRIIGSGTEDELFEAAAEEFGEAYDFHFVTRCYNVFEMRNYLKKGCVAISYVPGHYVTVADYDEEQDLYLVLDSHPIPKRPTSPWGDWFQWQRLETGGLTSQCYYIFI